MASWTLLDYVQTILSSMDSDEVNNIADTVESAQVVAVIRTCFEDIVSRADMSEHYGLFELEASGDADKPTLMTRPSDAMSIEWVKYNCETATDTDDAFKTIKFLALDDFLNRMHTLQESDTNVIPFTHTVGTSSLTFLYVNDKAPDYYTTFDDQTLIFDSYDADVDTTLQKTKSLAYGKKDQTWTETNTFVPFVDKEFQLLLLNESKALAFAELKQVGHDLAQKSARRGWIESQKKKRSVDRNRSELDRLPNYGRR